MPLPHLKHLAAEKRPRVKLLEKIGVHFVKKRAVTKEKPRFKKGGCNGYIALSLFAHFPGCTHNASHRKPQVPEFGDEVFRCKVCGRIVPFGH